MESRKEQLYTNRFAHLVQKPSTPPKTHVVPEALDCVEEIVNEDVVDEKQVEQRFSRLYKLLNNSQLNDDQLCNLLNYLTKHYEIVATKWNCERRLFDTVLSMKWSQKVFNHDSHVSSSLFNWLLESFCHNPTFVGLSLKLVTNLFCGNPNSKDDYFTTAEERNVFSKLHSFLKSILQIYPTFEKTTVDTLREKYPYFRGPSHNFLAFTMNALMTLCYIKPEERKRMFSFIMNRILTLDLTSFGNQMKDDIFQMEINAETNSISLFDATFDQMLHFVSYIFKKPCQPLIDTKEFTKMCLSVFEKEILPVTDCCYTHFILLYLGSCDETVCDEVLEFLFQIAISDKNELSRRAMFYLASYLVKARFVVVDVIVAFLEKFSNWIHSYIDRNAFLEESQFTCDISKHGVFYAFCQSLFYIIAMRHREFDDEVIKFVRFQNLQRIVSSNLNPLGACLPSVRDEFATVSRHYQFSLCSSIIERNRRLHLSLEMDVSFGSLYYFPFENFDLRLSSAKVNPLLNDYKVNLLNTKTRPTNDQADEIVMDTCSSVSPITTFLGSFVSDQTSANEEDDFYSMLISPA